MLSDPWRRQTYDSFGSDGLRSGGWSPRSAGFGSIEDIFQAFFGSLGRLRVRPRRPGQWRRRRRRRRGDAGGGRLRRRARGQLRRRDGLRALQGQRGRARAPRSIACERCGGKGQIRVVSSTPFGQLVRATACDVCHGDGRVAETPCEECDGSGRKAGVRRFDVEVPGRDPGRAAAADRRSRARRGARRAARGPLRRRAGGRGRPLPPRRRGPGLDRRRPGDGGDARDHGQRRDPGRRPRGRGAAGLAGRDRGRAARASACPISAGARAETTASSSTSSCPATSARSSASSPRRLNETIEPENLQPTHEGFLSRVRRAFG